MTKWKRFLPFVCETENQIQIPPKKTHVCIVQLYRCIPCIPCHNLPNAVPQIQIRYLLFVFASDKMLYFVKISQGLCQTMSQSDTSNQHCCLRLFPRILDFCLKKDLKNRLRMRGCVFATKSMLLYYTQHYSEKISQKFSTRFPNTWRGGCLFFRRRDVCAVAAPYHISHIELIWIELRRKKSETSQ